jgi:peptide-methionine (S)-S-oxide reductase
MMKKVTAPRGSRTIAALLILSAAAAVAVAAPRAEKEPAAPLAAAPAGSETAVLAGGCFWGVEAVFERLEGVLDVTSGYAGGDRETAHYEMVGTGRTGHAESVRIVFDPARISYETLLGVFFTVAHDPTELNRQGPDVGTQYRSAIFYSSEEQRRTAEEAIRALRDSGGHRAPIVTEVSALKAFYPAEDYHQDFMRRNPMHPYILYWDAPKIARLEREFPALLAHR